MPFHRSISLASDKGRLLPDGSERDFVVEIAALAAPARHRGLPLARSRARRAEVAALGVVAATSAAARAIEHGQRRVEALQHHFGRVLLHALLVGPFARLQRAFQVNLGALLQVLLGDLGQPLVEDHYAVPLGLFLALAGRLVAPALRRRDTHIHDRPAVLHAPHFGILAQIADQNDLVDRTCHCSSPLILRITLRARPSGRPPDEYLSTPIWGRKHAIHALFSFCSSIAPMLPQGGLAAFSA